MQRIGLIQQANSLGEFADILLISHRAGHHGRRCAAGEVELVVFAFQAVVAQAADQLPLWVQVHRVLHVDACAACAEIIGFTQDAAGLVHAVDAPRDDAAQSDG